MEQLRGSTTKTILAAVRIGIWGCANSYTRRGTRRQGRPTKFPVRLVTLRACKLTLRVHKYPYYINSSLCSQTRLNLGPRAKRRHKASTVWIGPDLSLLIITGIASIYHSLHYITPFTDHLQSCVLLVHYIPTHQHGLLQLYNLRRPGSQSMHTLSFCSLLLHKMPKGGLAPP